METADMVVSSGKLLFFNRRADQAEIVRRQLRLLTTCLSSAWRGLGCVSAFINNRTQAVRLPIAVDDFRSRLEVLPYDAKAAQHYGAIRAALEKLGQTIRVNDLHIAGHARSAGEEPDPGQSGFSAKPLVLLVFFCFEMLWKRRMAGARSKNDRKPA